MTAPCPSTPPLSPHAPRHHPCPACRACPALRGAFEEALRHQYAEGHAYEETISWAKAKQALRSPSNWVLITQAIPGCLPWGMMQTYFNDYLSQVRFEDQGSRQS
jgi:hypothetical protein